MTMTAASGTAGRSVMAPEVVTEGLGSRGAASVVRREGSVKASAGPGSVVVIRQLATAAAGSRRTGTLCQTDLPELLGCCRIDFPRSDQRLSGTRVPMVTLSV